MNSLKTLSLCGAVLTAATVSLCVAAETESKIDEVIVISSRIEQPLREVGTSVSVLTENDLKAMGYTDISDVLRTVPGIGVSNSGGLGKQTALRIRGEEGFRSQVYIDGMDITDPSGTQAQPQIQQIMTRGVSGVEILRGPQGVMYGADAGGVVNISTRRPQPGFSGDVAINGGRYDTLQEFAQLGGGSEFVDFNISALHLESDGFNARDTDTVLRDDDGYENQTYHGRIGFNLGGGFRFDTVVRSVSGESEYDGCSAAPFYISTNDCIDNYDQLSWLAGLEWKGENASQKLSLQKTDIERETIVDSALGQVSDGDVERIEYVGTHHFNDALQFVYGIDHKQETLRTATDDKEQDLRGYFVEYQGGFAETFYITAGVRHDDHDEFGAHNSYRVSAAQLIALGSHELKLKTSYSTGFRAPSLYEVDNKLSADENLTEETSKGYELGGEMYFAKGINAELVYFDQRIENELYYYFDPVTFDGGYTQDSGSESRSKGWELSGSAPFGELFVLRGNYTNTKATTDADTPRLRRPKHQVNLGLDANLLSDSLLLSAFWRYSDDVVDYGGTDLDDYQVVTFSARYYPIGGLEISARIENAFDEDYTEVRTYNTSGRAGYVGVNFQF